MDTMMATIKKRIIKAFWLLFFVSMFGILIIALGRPLNNLIPGRMVLYTLVWILFFGGVWLVSCLTEQKILLSKKEDFTAKKGSLLFGRLIKFVFLLYPLLYGLALFGVSCLLRCGLFTDYQNVYEAALHLALGEEVTNWEYFARWNNNVGCMLALSGIFSAGKIFMGIFSVGQPLTGHADLYYFALFVNVAQVVMVIYCLSYLSRKLIKNHPVAAPMATLMVCTIWIPIWANSSIFYSDQLSFGAGIFGVTLLVRGRQKRQELLYCVGAGALFAAGAIIKATSATILIALLFGCFLFYRFKDCVRQIVTVLAAFLLVYVVFSAFCRTLPYQEDVERLKMPVEYWIALGLGENGTYGDSEEFAIQCQTAENVQERRIIARKQIADQIHNAWDLGHIISKARQNFGCGDMGAAGYLLFPERENLLWHWFSMDGDYYWKYACLSTAFFFSVLFFLGTGGLLQFMQKAPYSERDMGFFAAALAFWGLCLFLMMWEAQDKQLYNHSSWMILSLISSLNLLGSRLKERKTSRHRQHDQEHD